MYHMHFLKMEDFNMISFVVWRWSVWLKYQADNKRIFLCSVDDFDLFSSLYKLFEKA